MKWLIELPVWGERCTTTLLRYGLPSLRAAMNECPGDYSFMIHTDRPEDFKADFGDLHVLYAPVPEGKDDHHKLGNCHRLAFDYADIGEHVIIGTADLVYSKECFKAIALRFAAGKKLIVCAASRCLLNGAQPPIGASASRLLDWTVANAHPTIKQLVWGEGKSACPWSLYFHGPHGIVLRGLHLHPLAAVKFDGMGFEGVDVDETLPLSFDPGDIHLVTSPDELALAELSPIDRQFVCYDHVISTKSVYKWALGHTNRMHHWQFGHRIIIQGTGEDNLDVEPCNEIMEKLKYSRTFCYDKEG